MAIVGGAVVTPVLGFMQRAMGTAGLVVVLLACLAYLLGLGLFALRQARSHFFAHASCHGNEKGLK